MTTLKPTADPGAADESAALPLGKALVLLVGAFVVSSLEALAYLIGGPFEWLAARLWLLTGVGLVCLGTFEIGRALVADARRSRLLTLLMMCAVLVVSLWGVTGVEHVGLHHEATQQVARGLESFGEPGWNYTDWGFIKYPNRQYLLTAIPSALRGRGITTLRLGYALPFLFGILVFWAGVRQSWSNAPYGIQLAALTALAVLAFPYAVRYLRAYEQAVLPLSLTLIAAGWLLMTLQRPTMAALIGLSWIGALLGCSYTPSLGSWFALIIALVWLAGRTLRQRNTAAALSWVAVLVVTVSFGLLSFVTRWDLFVGREHGVNRDAWTHLQQAFLIFFVGEPLVYIPPVLYLPIVAALLLGLAGRLGSARLVTSWWVIAVIVAANVLAGYAAPPPDLAMHRTLIVVPLLLLLSGSLGLAFLRRLDGGRLGSSVIAVLALLVTLQVVWNLVEVTREYRPGLREFVYSDMLEQARLVGAHAGQSVNVVLISQHLELGNAEDYLEYFFPNHTIERSLDGACSMDVSEALTIAYVDATLWQPGLPAWADRDSATTITYEQRDGLYHASYEMVRFVIAPPSPATPVR